MENIGTTAHSKVAIELDFSHPMEGDNIAEFTLAPRRLLDPGSPGHRWPGALHQHGASNFLVIDTMIGNDFETRLADLKAAAEK